MCAGRGKVGGRELRKIQQKIGRQKTPAEDQEPQCSSVITISMLYWFTVLFVSTCQYFEEDLSFVGESRIFLNHLNCTGIYFIILASLPENLTLLHVNIMQHFISVFTVYQSTHLGVTTTSIQRVKSVL